jgi:hypothetical protein
MLHDAGYNLKLRFERWTEVLMELVLSYLNKKFTNFQSKNYLVCRIFSENQNHVSFKVLDKYLLFLHEIMIREV